VGRDRPTAPRPQTQEEDAGKTEKLEGGKRKKGITVPWVFHKDFDRGKNRTLQKSGKKGAEERREKGSLSATTTGRPINAAVQGLSMEGMDLEGGNAGDLHLVGRK